MLPMNLNVEYSTAPHWQFSMVIIYQRTVLAFTLASISRCAFQSDGTPVLIRKSEVTCRGSVPLTACSIIPGARNAKSEIKVFGSIRLFRVAAHTEASGSGLPVIL